MLESPKLAWLSYGARFLVSYSPCCPTVRVVVCLCLLLLLGESNACLRWGPTEAADAPTSRLQRNKGPRVLDFPIGDHQWARRSKRRWTRRGDQEEAEEEEEEEGGGVDEEKAAEEGGAAAVAVAVLRLHMV